MQQCPKCAKVYVEDLKICRICGSILEPYKTPDAVPKEKQEPDAELLTIANVVEDLSPEEKQPAVDSDQNHAVWVCPQCKKTVPGNFDVCWNCFTMRDGQFDPEFAEIAAAAEVTEDQDDEEIIMAEAVSPQRENRLCCTRCGSDKIARDVRVRDQGQYSNGVLQAVVYGDPGAILFKEAYYAALHADICGRCGHVEFRVDNPAELYEHYLKSQR
jgi:rRNA maturation endonuclease Nob1